VFSASWFCLTCVTTADWVFPYRALIMWLISRATPFIDSGFSMSHARFYLKVCLLPHPPPRYLTIMAAISTAEIEMSSEHPPWKPLWQHCVRNTPTTPSLSFDSFVGVLLVPLLCLIFLLCIPYFASSLHLYCWIAWERLDS